MLSSHLTAIHAVCAGILLGMSASAADEQVNTYDREFYIGQFTVEDARADSQNNNALSYRIIHDDPRLLRTQLSNWVLTLNETQDSVSFKLRSYPTVKIPQIDNTHLDSTFLIDYTEPSIQALKTDIEQRYGAQPAPEDLEQFVFEHISDKNLGHRFDVASRVALSQSGDCTEHAVLLTALLRMYKHPARAVIGVYVSPQEPMVAYGHAWTEHYTDSGWAGLDGTQIENNVGNHYIPLGVIKDESIAYRLGVFSSILYLAIDKIVLK